MTEPVSTTPSDVARPSTSVEGVFTDRSSVVRAVERLSEKSVPADSIRVFVRDEDGGRQREIEVEDESGALRGALYGAGVGGMGGLAVAIAVASGAYGPVEVGFLTFRGISGAISAVLAMAAAAVPLGALLGLGYWQGRKKIDKEELRSGSALVIVESDDLSELAERTLREAGAREVRVDTG